MARHIMAVCVVCLLCADHLPCQQHVETLFPAQQILNPEYTPLNAVVYNTHDLSPSSALSSKAHTTETTVAYATSSSDNRRRRRTKRHSANGHDHGHDHNDGDVSTRPEITEAFLERIFKEFGSDNDTINIQDFQRILKKLGLHQPEMLHKHDNINDNETVSAKIEILLL